MLISDDSQSSDEPARGGSTQESSVLESSVLATVNVPDLSSATTGTNHNARTPVAALPVVHNSNNTTTSGHATGEKISNTRGVGSRHAAEMPAGEEEGKMKKLIRDASSARNGARESAYEKMRGDPGAQAGGANPGNPRSPQPAVGGADHASAGKGPVKSQILVRNASGRFAPVAGKGSQKIGKNAAISFSAGPDGNFRQIPTQRMEQNAPDAVRREVPRVHSRRPSLVKDETSGTCRCGACKFYIYIYICMSRCLCKDTKHLLHSLPHLYFPSSAAVSIPTHTLQASHRMKHSQKKKLAFASHTLSA